MPFIKGLVCKNKNGVLIFQTDKLSGKTHQDR